MRDVLKRFFASEQGAVTVDWVVITAAVVGMAAISFFAIEDSANGLIASAGGAVTAEDDF